MRETEFREWLDKRRWKGAPLEKKAKDNRVRRSARAERGLKGIGFAQKTLEDVFADGQWDALLARLAELKAPGADPAAVLSVVPQATEPSGQLTNMIAAVKQYGYFLYGRDPNYGATAGELEDEDEPSLYIVTNLYGKEDGLARFLERKEWTLLDDRGSHLNGLVKAMQPGDIVALRDYLPNQSDLPFPTPGKRVSAMRFRAIGKVTHQRGDGIGVDVDWQVLPEPRIWYFYTFSHAVWQPPEGSEYASRLRAFLLEGAPQDYDWFIQNWWPKAKDLELNSAALATLRRIFLEKHPDFQTFATCASFEASEDGYKRALIARTAALMAHGSGSDDVAVGAALLDLATGKGGLESNLIDWRTAKLANDVRTARPGVIERATAELARSEDGLAAVAAWVEEVWPSLEESALEGRPCAESRTIPTIVRALVDPAGMFPIRSRPTDNAAMMLTGKWAFPTEPLSAQDLVRTIALAEAIMLEMREWGWEPRDYWDVQGFLWETCQKRLPIAGEPDLPPISTEQDRTMPEPTNLILYGPPGTGKTYATAREAVVLCDGTVPEDRAELMRRYNDLTKAGRIGFVTFHQSFSYEDFVEGLRPAPIKGEDGSAAGFQLLPEDGVFMRMADRCLAPGTGTRSDDYIELEGRKFFKMSLGEAGKREWDYVFNDSIAQGYALFGFDSIDWTDDRFSDPDEILRAARTKRPSDTITLRNGVVSCTNRFRNIVQPGDVLVVSKGLKAFRAIGIVEGEYEYHPTESGAYNHRRNVRWLWHDPAGLPLETITPRAFAMETIYQIGNSDFLDVAALERLVNQSVQPSPARASEPHVLIIDEINRANISKVFGELITLIEPDKRLGKANALTVRLPYSKREFGVPANLHIIGTMNTADRSIALLDTALRRRFRFKEIAPQPDLLPENAHGVPLRRVLAAINSRIEYLIDRDHRIGHAFFMGKGADTRAGIDAVMRDKVIPLLQEYFFEDWSRIAAVVGRGFIMETKLPPPPGLEGLDAKPSWSVREVFPENAYDVLLGKAQAPVEELVEEPDSETEAG